MVNAVRVRREPKRWTTNTYFGHPVDVVATIRAKLAAIPRVLGFAWETYIERGTSHDASLVVRLVDLNRPEQTVLAERAVDLTTVHASKQSNGRERQKESVASESALRSAYWAVMGLSVNEFGPNAAELSPGVGERFDEYYSKVLLKLRDPTPQQVEVIDRMPPAAFRHKLGRAAVDKAFGIKLGELDGLRDRFDAALFAAMVATVSDWLIDPTENWARAAVRDWCEPEPPSSTTGMGDYRMV
jgi:hypothetical protein